MREIKFIAIHCSATVAKADIGATEIKQWHTAKPPKGNGWSEIGYHFVIRRNGKIENGRPVERAGAHVKNFNSNSIGICLVGGLDASGAAENNFTAEQFASLETLLKNLKGKFPQAQILGHRDFPKVAKECPCFDVRSWLKERGM